MRIKEKTKEKRRRLLIGFRKAEIRAGYLFILPAMLLFSLFLWLPIVTTFFLSFTRWDIVSPLQWAGVQNYQRLFNDEILLKSFLNTAVFAAGTVIPGTVISLLLALLVRKKIPGITVFRACYYVPVLMSWVAVSLIWLWLYESQLGLLNQFLQQVGIPQQSWLGDPKRALLSIMVVCLWQGVGWDMLIFLAALQGVPEVLYEAAKIDGANVWHCFWHVTLPWLRPVTLFVVVGYFIWACRMFTPVYTMTRGGPLYSTSTVVYQIYMYGFTRLRMGLASAMSFVLFAFIFVASLIIVRIMEPTER